MNEFDVQLRDLHERHQQAVESGESTVFVEVSILGKLLDTVRDYKFMESRMKYAEGLFAAHLDEQLECFHGYHHRPDEKSSCRICGAPPVEITLEP